METLVIGWKAVRPLRAPIMEIGLYVIGSLRENRLALARAPHESDMKSSYSEYRIQITERQLRLIQRVWPGRDWSDSMKKLHKHQAKEHRHGEKANMLRQELKL